MQYLYLLTTLIEANALTTTHIVCPLLYIAWYVGDSEVDIAGVRSTLCVCRCQSVLSSIFNATITVVSRRGPRVIIRWARWHDMLLSATASHASPSSHACRRYVGRAANCSVVPDTQSL